MSDGVIHRLDKILDVVAVEGRDEAPPNGKQHLSGDPVGLVFEGDDFRDAGIAVVTGQKGVERLSGVDDGFGVLCEQIEELLFVREELAEPLEHGRSLFSGLFGTRFIR